MEDFIEVKKNLKEDQKKDMEILIEKINDQYLKIKCSDYLI